MDERIFDDVIKPFKTSREQIEDKPIEGRLIYISSANMHDNPFVKMVREYLKTIKEETDENN